MEAIGRGDDDDRASKKAFISNPSSSSSSVHEVLSNYDLLIEILLLLPLISLQFFKRVSKHWLTLITSPSFISKRTQISSSLVVPPSGIFIKSSFKAYNFLSFRSNKRSILFTYKSDTFDTSLVIEQSCNGLLLCRDYDDKRYIYNLTINMFKMLPPVRSFDHRLINIFRMAFGPTKSPHYKVVHVGSVHDVADVRGYSFKMEIYSSETGLWSVFDDRFPSSSFFGFKSGIYSSGAIPWFTNRNDPFHFKLEIVDRLVLTKIQTPSTVEGKVHDDCKLFGSYDSLLLLCKEYYLSRKLNIYEMKNGYPEWSIKYIVDLDNMLLRRTWKLPKGWSCYNIRSIFFGEREEDSFMVIELSGKFLHYKFVSATVTKILDLGKGVGECGCHDFIECGCHDFIASFAHV